MRTAPLAAILGLAVAWPLLAAESGPLIKPEIQRAPATPQPVNQLHTIRQIPEACARLEGMFTGTAAQPYKFAAVRTSPNCQPRARFVDFDKAQPSAAKGWTLNDVIQVPYAACPSQQATVRVWRKPADAAPPQLDAQGRSRLYLEEMKASAKSGELKAVPMFAAEMKVEGKECG